MTTIEKTREVKYTQDTVRFPEGMRFVFAPDDDAGNTFERDALMLYPYIMEGRISNGRAAEILGVNKLDLLDYYTSRGLMVLTTTVDEVRADLQTLRELHGRA